MVATVVAAEIVAVVAAIAEVAEIAAEAAMAAGIGGDGIEHTASVKSIKPHSTMNGASHFIPHLARPPPPHSAGRRRVRHRFRNRAKNARSPPISEAGFLTKAFAIKFQEPLPKPGLFLKWKIRHNERLELG